MKRTQYTAEFKSEAVKQVVDKGYSVVDVAKVALEAVRGVMTINEVAQKFEVHPMMVRHWKKEFLDNAGSVFAT